MTEVTENAESVVIDGKSKRKKTTTAIPCDVLDKLKTLRIIADEPSYSIIERLLDEHNLKTMQKVVAKRVR